MNKQTFAGFDIVISVISGMTFWKNREGALNQALRIGYDGIESSPIKKGITGQEDCSFFKDSWRPELEHFWQIQNTRLFDDLLALFVIFKQGSSRKSIIDNYRKNGVTEIAHKFSIYKNKLFEVNVQMGSPYVIKVKAGNSVRCLVLNTRHLMKYEKKFGVPAESLIEMFRENLAPVVGFQIVGDVEDFITATDSNSICDGGWTRVREVAIFKAIIKALKRNFDSGIYIGITNPTILVEYNPKLAYFSKKRSEYLMESVLWRVEVMSRVFFV